ncbi:MAG: hypothetical protein O2931_01820 [Planctomycetota bacterium]|nr:hypothetical protein [Planctomycetota bacterium]MDA1177511.1 hypothetical protein [Planctomycetota bacterium]
MSRHAYKVFASIRLLLKEAIRWPCRECGERVRLLEDVCPECGTYSPLRLPCSFVIQAAFLSASAILAIHITRLIAWH